MTEKGKENESILGLGLPKSASDPTAWRPSKAARPEESAPSLTDAEAGNEKVASRRDEEKSENRDAFALSNAPSAATQNRKKAPDAAAWRPSKLNEERLSSLSPVRGRKRLAMSPRMRLIFTAALFACGAYFFVKVWLMPEAGELHVALVIAALAMVLLFVSAVGRAARRRRKGKRGDDQSILRL